MSCLGDRAKLLCLLCSLIACGGETEAPATDDTQTGAGTPAVKQADGPSVLLISIDTLRADHLPIYGYPSGSTPHIDGLAKESVVFENAHSHAPITLPSHASILTGLYPPEHGLRANGSYYAGPSLTTLAERFKPRGYRTGAFVSAYVLDSRFGLDQGFDTYDDDLDDGRQMWSKFGVKDRRAEDTVGRFIKWVDARDKTKKQPFFSWVHLYDPHYEYSPPEPFLSRFRNRYDGEIAYTDSQVGRMLQALRQRGLYDDLTIVITADHGESLGEHGESTHSLFVYEATQHIPLIIRLPRGKLGGKRIPQLTRHVDIAPTLMDVAGATWEGKTKASGKSLLPLMEGRDENWAVTSYAEAYLPKEQFGWAPLFALKDDRFKVIDAPKPETYDLGQDPKERTNLISSPPADTGKLRTSLGGMRARFDKSEGSAQKRAMDAETEAKLRALGYVADEAPAPEQANRDPKDMIGIHEAREKVHRYMDQGAFADALVALDPILLEDPGNASLHGDQAACHAELGHWDEAEKAYLRTRELSPKRLSTATGLTKVYFKGRRDFPKAARELKAAFALAHQEPGLFGLQGDLLHEQGKYVEAVVAYQKAIDAGDQTPSYWLGYGSALHLTGQDDKARAALERALRMERDNPVGHYNYGIVLDGLGLYAAAIGELRESLRLNPGLVPAYVALARTLTREGRLEESRRVLEAGLKAAPNQPELVFEMGSLLVRGGKPAAGIPLLQKTVASQPGSAPARTNLGFAFEQVGKLDAAYAQYVELRRIYPVGTPMHCDAIKRLARIRQAQGNASEAQQHGADAQACDRAVSTRAPAAK